MKFDKFILALGVGFFILIGILHYLPLAKKIHNDPCITLPHEYRYNLINLTHAGSLSQFNDFETTETLKYGLNPELSICHDEGLGDTAKLYLW